MPSLAGRLAAALAVVLISLGTPAGRGAPAHADGPTALPAGDFDATFSPSSGGPPFLLRCSGGTCQFLGGGPRLNSPTIRTFAQASVIDVSATTPIEGDCGRHFPGYSEKLHVD